ncbi:MAG: hypothetical protein PHP35_02150 [Candidatus Colwellbacteria bacterium]|nr:hypothetical protein [Candidatus Colwellbacteria bacterium]
MSDALTDLARDEERDRCISKYLEAVCYFLKDQTDDNKRIAVEAARGADEVPKGFFGGQTSLAKNIEELLEKLASGDKQAWAKFLFGLGETGHDFHILKSLSPFAGKLLISVDYGCGFANFRGEVESLIFSIIHEGKGWKTYDADDYLIALPMPNTAEAEVFWIQCGIFGPEIPVDRPRSANKS